MSIWILTILQGINFVLWLLNAKYQLVTNVWVQFPLMLFVGILGGAMYVNVFANLMDDPMIPEKDRELAINLVVSGSIICSYT